MWQLIGKIGRWVISNALVIAVVWIVVLGGVAAYLAGKAYFQGLPKERVAMLEELGVGQEQLQAAEKKLQSFTAAMKEKIAQADDGIQKADREIREQARSAVRLQRDIKRLEAAIQWLRRLLGLDTRERVELERRKQEMAESVLRKRAAEKLRNELIREKDLLKDDLDAGREEHELQTESARRAVDEREEELEELDGKLAQVAGAKHWIKEAFSYVGPALIVATLALFVLPLVIKLVLYYLWAPMAEIADPIQFEDGALEHVRVTPSEVAKEVRLDPGEYAVIKHRFYQASDDKVKMRTKFLFDWHYPFTSLACGLIEMTRVSNLDLEKARVFTLSSQDQAEVEIALVDIPEGASVICRPSYLAGSICRESSPLRIRSRWKIFSVHSWITLQFRFFQFHGPVRLALWAWRGVRAETLTQSDFKEGNRKRTNQDATIGFEPALGYASRRAETFWSFFRGLNPLFDDIFSGQGTFLCQQIARRARGNIIRRFWNSFWGIVSKVFGL